MSELEVCGNKYQLPITVPFTIAPSLESHKPWPQYKFDDIYAVDFLVPMGTPVYSVCSGVIIKMIFSSAVGGDDFAFAGRDNQLFIKEDDTDLIFAYRHLAYKTSTDIAAFIKDSHGIIQKGTELGAVGMTGWTSDPHLHFVVYMELLSEEFASQKITLSL